ncbi:MAG: nucleotidyltransferase domain-containing protein [Actinobacteria bacterium]|nr:nucleotidyltransferase domain-containing protein [Actinomycetota bacterium]
MINKREKALKENLERIILDLKEKYNPNKVILFGSYASGKIKNFSDLDLLIIKDTKSKFFDRLREVTKICNYDIGVDFLIYTPEEYEDQLNNNLFFKEEVVSKGKVIYAK